MAKREIARLWSHDGDESSLARTLERWQHIQRFCETTGSKSSILRGQLPDEITEGEGKADPAPPLSRRDAFMAIVAFCQHKADCPQVTDPSACGCGLLKAQLDLLSALYGEGEADPPLALRDRVLSVTRLEVINETGRVFTCRPCEVDVSFQDQGRTLKVFVNRGAVESEPAPLDPPRSEG